MPSPYSPIEPSRVDEDEAEQSPANVWTPAPLRTAADERGDTGSLSRSLDERLVLLVRARGAETWSLPAAAHREGETLRATAERALRAAVGGGVEAYFVGNSPAAHLPASEVDGAAGATFFHRAQLLGGRVDTRGGELEVAWLNPGEIPRYLKDQPALAALLSQLLKS